MDPSRYSKARGTSSARDQEGLAPESRLDDEERFLHCDRLILPCPKCNKVTYRLHADRCPSSVDSPTSSGGAFQRVPSGREADADRLPRLQGPVSAEPRLQYPHPRRAGEARPVLPGTLRVWQSNHQPHCMTSFSSSSCSASRITARGSSSSPAEHGVLPVAQPQSRW
jgi:hypothetical protein